MEDFLRSCGYAASVEIWREVRRGEAEREFKGGGGFA